MARTFQDMVQEVTDTVEKAYSQPHWLWTIESIDKLVNQINWNVGKKFQEFTADELSRIWGRLATFQYNLIEIRDSAYRNIKVSKAHARIVEDSIRSNVKTKLKATTDKPLARDIDLATEARMAEFNLVVDLHEAKYEKLQSYWYSINTILRRIETRISILWHEQWKWSASYSFLESAWDVEMPPILNISDESASDALWLDISSALGFE